MSHNLVFIIILIADVYAILKISQSSAPTIHKVLWIVGVIVLPVIGLLVWAVLGPGGPHLLEKFQ